MEQQPPAAGPDEGDLAARAAAWLEETANVAARPDRSRADELRVARFAVQTLARLAVEARARWSAAVVATIQPTYRAQIRAMAEIVRQASTAAVEHGELIEALHCSGVTGYSVILRPMGFGPDGALRLDLPYSTASLWLAEARNFGLWDE